MSMFSRVETKIPGCFEITFKKLGDNRGAFIKTFHEDMFRDLNIEMHLGEEFFSTSKKNVFRGMHFQIPPSDVDKIVFCVKGNVTDYVADLRVGSPTYGEYLSFELDGTVPKAIFIPKGLAHGFYVNSEEAIMHYKSSGVFDPACDTGLTYKSFPFAKDILDPVITEKDLNLVSFQDFKNPFTYKP